MDEDTACTEGWGIFRGVAHRICLSLLQLEAYILVSGLPPSALTLGLVSPVLARSGLSFPTACPLG